MRHHFCYVVKIPLLNILTHETTFPAYFTETRCNFAFDNYFINNRYDINTNPLRVPLSRKPSTPIEFDRRIIEA